MFDLPDWAEEALAGISALQVVLWILGAALIVFLAIKLWPFVRNAVSIVDALVKLPATVESLEKLTEDVATVKHEVLPNNGASLRDGVNRTEVALTALTAEVAHVRRQQASTKTTLTRTARKLEEHLTSTKETR